jgi:GTPase SAR1 family protein
MPKPPIIAEIEAHYGLTLRPAEDATLESLMRYGRQESGKNRYLLEGERLIGLNLRSNGLAEFPFLERPELHGLQALQLSENALKALTIPAAMRELQYLDVSDNKDLRELACGGPLPRLRILDASDSGLAALHLLACPALEKLDASRNQLAAFAFAAASPALTWLDLSGNEGLRELALPGGFSWLAHLHLRGCGMERLDIGGRLPRLRVLDLEKNRLKQLPSGFKLPKSLETLYLDGNRLADIPESVRGSGERHNSCEDVRNYLRSIAKAEEVEYLHQAKLILVGNGEVGKSSIRIKLLDETAPLPKKSERTPGLDISVTPYTLEALPPELTKLEEPIDFQLNIWDFGGQSRYREVQQLFCSPKSLYLFVTACDDRPEQKEDYVTFEYWMDMVHALSYEPEKQRSSPVIHVVNKIDLARVDIDQPRHNQLGNVARFLEISCETLANFPLLRQAIREVLPQVGENVFRDKFNQAWLNVKEALEERRGENHLSYREYVEEICAPALTASDADTWLRSLHNIGAVIHFGQNEKLKDWIILNPNWVKDAIFKVLDCGLNSPLPRASFDHFIWKEYTPEERDKLLALMAAYGLCYEQQDDFGKAEYVVPGLLEEDAPAFADKIPPDLPSVLLRFQYAPFLPAGSVNKLMVRQKDYIFRKLMWKNHAILHDPPTATYAHVWEEWREHCVYLQLYGNNPGTFFHQLSAALEDINTDFKDTHFLKQLELKAEGEHKGQWLGKGLLKDLGREDLAFLWEEPVHRYGMGVKPSLFLPDMKTIQQLIANGDIAGALQALEAQVPPRLANEVTQLWARFNSLERNNRLGVVSTSEANLERNRIVSAILDLAKEAGPGGGSPVPPGTQPPQEPQETTPKPGKKKVLFICSSPDGKNPLDFGKAFREIEKARQSAGGRDNFDEVKIQTSVQRRELVRTLTRFEPDVLHISLHSSKAQGLYFEDRAGAVAPIDAENFAETIRTYCQRPNGKGKIELIILDACNSQEHGQAVLPFADYVICTRDFYPDQASIIYAEEFYNLFFEGESIVYCHEAAKTAIRQENYPQPAGNEHPIHEIPILIQK